MLPTLSKKAGYKVTELTNELKIDIEYMKRLLLEQDFGLGKRGFALAHCQVSDTPARMFVARKHFFLFNLDGEVKEVEVFINPKILSKEGKYTASEACLSFPFRPPVKVTRYESVHFEYYDEDLQYHTADAVGLHAQVIIHEINHLNGQHIYMKS